MRRLQLLGPTPRCCGPLAGSAFRGSAGGMMRWRGVHHAEFAVLDYDESVGFYERGIGKTRGLACIYVTSDRAVTLTRTP